MKRALIAGLISFPFFFVVIHYRHTIAAMMQDDTQSQNVGTTAAAPAAETKAAEETQAKEQVRYIDLPPGEKYNRDGKYVCGKYASDGYWSFTTRTMQPGEAPEENQLYAVSSCYEKSDLFVRVIREHAAKNPEKK